MHEFGPDPYVVVLLALVVLAFLSLVAGVMIYGVMRFARHLSLTGRFIDPAHVPGRSTLPARKMRRILKAAAAVLALSFAPLWSLNYLALFSVMTGHFANASANQALLVSLGTDLLELCLAALLIGLASSFFEGRGL